MNNTNKGFTLIELMVVIAIIGLLSGVVLSSFDEVKKRAENTKILAEAHQLSIELQLYYDENDHYPHPVSGAGMYCIGGHNCKIAGVSVTDNLNDQELAFNFSFSEPSINNMLASTFNYSSSISDIEIDGNSGFVYHYQPDSPNPEVITFATHSLTEDTANSYSVPAQEFVEKGGLTLIGEAELDAVAGGDHNENFIESEDCKTTLKTEVVTESIRACYKPVEWSNNCLDVTEWESITCPEDLSTRYRCPQYGSTTALLVVDNWPPDSDPPDNLEPSGKYSWTSDPETRDYYAGSSTINIITSTSCSTDQEAQDYEDFMNNHDTMESIDRDIENGNHDQKYSDWATDHDTMESIDRDIDNGDHDQDYSDWATDHDTMESIDRDIDNGSHDQDYSDWATDHDVWESIGRDIDNGDHNQEYSNWIIDNNLNSKDNPAYHEMDTSNNVFLDVGVN